MFQKSFLSILIGFVCFNGLNAQQAGSPFQNLINVNTKSPEAASLGKFGNVPVSYITGVPGISIPVYDISVGSLKVPISLDYHASGIRVDETSSCVGIGWALSGGGNVSRNMSGLPDESTGFLEPNANTVFNNASSNWQYIYSLRNGSSDAEPDIFQYSAGGISGKFIFKKDGSIIQIPITNNKITFNTGSSFTIIDPEGTTYFFNEKRQNSSSDANTQAYVSTWSLTYIVAANTVDTIKYVYEDNIYSSYEKATNFTQNFGETMGASPISSGEFATATQDVASHQSSVTLTHQEFYLKEINWNNGKIVFKNIADRQDITGSGLRLGEVEIYAKSSSQLKLIKKLKLFQSYFFSNVAGGPVSEKNYRLKLDSVGYQNVLTSALEQWYNLEYNSTPIPPRESYAQDRWGYSNGHYDNSDLMPKQTAIYNGKIYSFGGANRDTDSLSHLACIIKSIKYPTKGKSLFEFEPHRYNTSLYKTEVKTRFAEACCGTSSYTSTTFTVNSLASNFSYTGFISKFNYPDVTDRPFIKITDQTTGQQYLKIVTVPTTATDIDFSTSTQPMSNLQVGHTYFVEINIFTSNPNVRASITINWIETDPNVPEVKLGGGLRVKSVTNTDSDDRFVSKETYKYGSDNTGKILTPQYYQDINYETVVHRVGGKFDNGGGFCLCCYVHEYDINLLGANYIPPGYSTVYHANSVLPTSQYSGSPVLYPEVTKTQVDWLGNVNGKSVYSYSVVEDGASSPFQPITGILTNYNPSGGVALISNVWRNGSLLSEEHYRSSGGAFQLISQKINHISSILFSLENFLKVKPNFVHTGCEIQGSSTVTADFLLSLSPVTTGAMVIDTTTETSLDYSGKALVNRSSFTFGATPLLPIKIVTSSSKGDQLTQNIKYPKDLSVAGNVYEKMVNRNMLSATIQSQQLINNAQTSYLNINYLDWLGNSKLILPQYVEKQIRNATIETRLNFIKYDIAGNIQEQQKTNDVREVYLWGYNSEYPVAKILNSTYAICSTKVTQSILDNPTDDATLRSHLNNLRTIDGSLVTTYTYAPLIGMTSETDPTGKTTYYEYDSFNRLKNIKDYQGNIVKNFQYNYSQGCGANCTMLPMRTFTGYSTPGYPVGVFNGNKQFIGIANNASEFVSTWNSNSVNQSLGVLSAGTQPMQFNLTLASGATAPSTGVYGLRFYKWSGVTSANVNIGSDQFSFIDWGDGTTQLLTQTRQPNSIRNWYGYVPGLPDDISCMSVSQNHSYSNNQLKNITVFHNETTEMVSFNAGGDDLVNQSSITGNYPEGVKAILYSNISNSSDIGVLNFSQLKGVLQAHYQFQGSESTRHNNWQSINNFSSLKWLKMCYKFGNEVLSGNLRTNFPELKYLETQEHKQDVLTTWTGGGFKNLYMVAMGLTSGSITTQEIDLILNGQASSSVVPNGYTGFAPSAQRSAASNQAYYTLAARGWNLNAILNP